MDFVAEGGIWLTDRWLNSINLVDFCCSMTYLYNMIGLYSNKKQCNMCVSVCHCCLFQCMRLKLFTFSSSVSNGRLCEDWEDRRRLIFKTLFLRHFFWEKMRNQWVKWTWWDITQQCGLKMTVSSIITLQLVLFS